MILTYWCLPCILSCICTILALLFLENWTNCMWLLMTNMVQVIHGHGTFCYLPDSGFCWYCLCLGIHTTTNVVENHSICTLKVKNRDVCLECFPYWSFSFWYIMVHATCIRCLELGIFLMYRAYIKCFYYIILACVYICTNLDSLCIELYITLLLWISSIGNDVVNSSMWNPSLLL